MPDSERAIALLQQALGDKYEALGWIGGGGMAQVYLARHRVTGGRFAVKVLADSLCHDETVVRRFLQEARTAATLSGHPNVVSIFDVGQYSDLHYLIMQYVEGEDLRTRLTRCGRLPPAEAVRVVEQVAEALVFAASKHVVHRDLKPSNIRIDPSGRAVVLDFGIAKAGEIPTVMTAAGERLGTPYYMSPEHFLDGVCDHRSDLYALGVMFFELLTGVRPFEGDSVRAIESAHLSAAPRPPDELNPDVSPELATIVLRLLEKRPQDRYPTAQALLADLRAASGAPARAEMNAPLTAPAQAGPAPVPPLPPPSKRLPRWIWAAQALLAVAAVAGAALYWPRTATAPGLPPSLHTETGAMLLVSDGPFYVDAIAVSNTVFKFFCDATGYPYPEAPPGDPNYFFAKPEQPVLNVTQTEAAAFAKWCGKRLPTEQEWEKASAVYQSPARAWEWTSSAERAPEWFVLKSGEARPWQRTALVGAARPGATAVTFRCVKDPPR